MSNPFQGPAAPEIRPVADDEEFQAALRVRIAVFVDEQGGPLSDEPDAWDPAARQFVVLDRAQVVGTARVYHPIPGVAKIGRVCLLPEYRGVGWGQQLLAELLRYTRTLGVPEVMLDAQTAAMPFYERFGFVPEGEDFMEGGIPHRRMRQRL